MIIARLVLAVVAAAIHAVPVDALNSRPFNERFCAGMELEVRLPSGGRVDCLSSRYAIETEWAVIAR
jgi:hypothetical protein